MFLCFTQIYLIFDVMFKSLFLIITGINRSSKVENNMLDEGDLKMDAMISLLFIGLDQYGRIRTSHRQYECSTSSL